MGRPVSRIPKYSIRIVSHTWKGKSQPTAKCRCCSGKNVLSWYYKIKMYFFRRKMRKKYLANISKKDPFIYEP